MPLLFHTVFNCKERALLSKRDIWIFHDFYPKTKPQMIDIYKRHFNFFCSIDALRRLLRFATNCIGTFSQLPISAIDAF